MRTMTFLLPMLALMACDAAEPLDLVGDASVGAGPDVSADAEFDATSTVFETVDLLEQHPLIERATEPGQDDLTVHARVGTAEHTYVEFFSSDEDPEDIGVGVMAQFPNTPLVSSDFIGRHDPLDVFLAVAPLSMAVPEVLLDLREDDADTSVDARLALKSESLDDLADLPDMSWMPAAASCNFMKNWMNGWYGEDGSCAAGSNLNKTWNDFELICAYGDSSCDFVLDNVARGFCNGELDSGHLVQGRTTKVAGRWAKGGNITWNSSGYRSHQAVSNCPASNGDLQFYRERGSSSYLKLVPKNHGYNYFYGYNTPRPLTYWPNGGWKKDYTNSKHNGVKVRHNSGTSDEAIMCADVYNRYRTTDVSYSGSDNLCLSSNCDNSCTNN
ncbi:MAG: hypothetical protein AB8H79_06955 [Myxococcota bacterium]